MVKLYMPDIKINKSRLRNAIVRLIRDIGFIVLLVVFVVIIIGMIVLPFVLYFEYGMLGLGIDIIYVIVVLVALAYIFEDN